MRRSCIFCGGEDMSPEHIWPRWAAKLTAEAGPLQHRTWAQFVDTGPVDHEYSQLPYEQTAKVVCSECNTGWMCRLEESAKPYFHRMLHGGRRELTADAQRTLSAWAVKTSMVVVASKARGRSLIPVNDHLELRTELRPSGNVKVWIGAYDGSHPAIADAFGVTAVRADDHSEHVIWGTTITFGPVSFHCFGSDAPGFVEDTSFSAPWFQQIWPAGPVFTWAPTPCCDNQQLRGWIDGTLIELSRTYGMNTIIP